MVKPLIAGNWKMNTTTSQGASLVMSLRELIKDVSEEVEVVIAPPNTSLHHLHFLLAESRIKLSGQNMFWEKSGAFTGETSADMLKDAGCSYVIIGHSERRQYFHEIDEWVNKKVVAAIRSGLKPIICVGEMLSEREDQKTLHVVRTQLTGALKGLGPGSIKDAVIAYEPVWAIGTGRTATSEQAEEVHSAIRNTLYETFGRESAQDVRIIYGGSVKPANIDSLMAEPNIDGALVGGASLNAEEFARIVKFKRPQ